MREQTIDNFSNRYSVDQHHAGYVQETALLILNSVKKKWDLESEENEHLLIWACRLHEVGLAIAHDNYQKHGAYLVSKSDLPGFSYQEQQLLASLIDLHRGKFSNDTILDLPVRERKKVLYLAITLRIAVILQRSRMHTEIPAPEITVKRNSLRLRFEPQWLDQHPLIYADIVAEKQRLGDIDFRLKISKKDE